MGNWNESNIILPRSYIEREAKEKEEVKTVYVDQPVDFTITNRVQVDNIRKALYFFREGTRLSWGENGGRFTGLNDGADLKYKFYLALHDYLHLVLLGKPSEGFETYT